MLEGVVVSSVWQRVAQPPEQLIVVGPGTV